MASDRSKSIAQRIHGERLERVWSRLAEALCSYFRTEVHGFEQIPRSGPAIVIANHSGWSGADAVVLAHLLHTRLGREVRVLAHPLYFDVSDEVSEVSLGFGLRRANYWSGLKSLKAGRILLIFPEGERGNFKSSLKRYRLQPFHTGFVRLAMEAQAPVIPVVITGAEESHWSLGSLDLGLFRRRLRIPLPLNWLPFPAKWRIRILKPISFSLPQVPGVRRREWIEQFAEETHDHLQDVLSEEVRERPYIYWPPVLRGSRRKAG
jgi:1-acyl-sn-glycerol-3-phosphate acyltransferase